MVPPSANQPRKRLPFVAVFGMALQENCILFFGPVTCLGVWERDDIFPPPSALFAAFRSNLVGDDLDVAAAIVRIHWARSADANEPLVCTTLVAVLP
jgi:hypothetical protein